MEPEPEPMQTNGTQPTIINSIVFSVVDVFIRRRRSSRFILPLTGDPKPRNACKYIKSVCECLCVCKATEMYHYNRNKELKKSSYLYIQCAFHIYR